MNVLGVCGDSEFGLKWIGASEERFFHQAGFYVCLTKSNHQESKNELYAEQSGIRNRGTDLHSNTFRLRSM